MKQLKINMLRVRLDQQAETRLVELARSNNTSKSKVIRALINQAGGHINLSQATKESLQHREVPA